jgi:hypothetical protein
LYSSGAFHDITIGDNTLPHGGRVAGYKAITGWDAPTGVGSVSGGSLNFTITPEDDGFSVISSGNALTANVSLAYLDEQNSYFSTTNNLQIGANENLTCTVADWKSLNSTGIQVTSAPASVAESTTTIPLILTLSIISAVILTLKKRRKATRTSPNKASDRLA